MEKKIERDAGITLIEVLIVIAIVSVAAGMFAAGISLAGSRDAEKCAKLINNALETTRMNSLVQEGEFILTVDGDTQLLTITSAAKGIIEETKLPQRVSIQMQAKGNSSLAAGTLLEIEFDKTDGGVKKTSIDGTALGKESYHTVRISAETKSGGKKASVMLVRITGKHYVDYRQS